MGSPDEARGPVDLQGPNTDCYNTSVSTAPEGPDTVRIALSCLTTACIICLIVAAVVLFRLRETKIGRAGSPNELFISVFGCLLVYTEVLLGAVPQTPELCLLQMWFRHEGFSFCVLSLILRQHRNSIYTFKLTIEVANNPQARIYSIIHQRSWKNSFFRERNSYQAMLVLITFGIVLLSVRTIFIPEVPVRNVTGHVIGCTLNAGTYINIGGELALGGLLLYLCVHTRQVPSPYNDCYLCGLVAYNVLVGISLDTIHRGIGGEFSWEYAVVVSGFFRVHSLATSVLVGVIGGRVFMVFFPRREFFTTVSTVSNHDHAHRLRIVLENNGDIKTVTCYPCGPMIVTKTNEETVHAEEPPRGGEKPSQCAGYTEAEIDRLVSLYNAQKQEIKTLQRILETTNPSSPTKACGTELFSLENVGSLCPQCLGNTRRRHRCQVSQHNTDYKLNMRNSCSCQSFADTASTMDTSVPLDSPSTLAPEFPLAQSTTGRDDICIPENPVGSTS